MRRIPQATAATALGSLISSSLQVKRFVAGYKLATNQVGDMIMQINFTRNSSIFRKATLVLAAFCIFQVAVRAQSREEPAETLVNGQTSLVGLVRGEMLRFTAFNPSETDNGKPNEPITLRLRVYDAHGGLIVQSPALVIPPGEFRWVDFDHAELGTPSEPATSRNQIRTKPLWGLRSRSPLHVTTTLELLDSTTQRGTFKFFFNVEALP
jgi:hypothetical protein